ncbi:hypothetical protein AHAS_Ahas17G0171300 [Arachis hypogaea]
MPKRDHRLLKGVPLALSAVAVLVPEALQAAQAESPRAVPAAGPPSVLPPAHPLPQSDQRSQSASDGYSVACCDAQTAHNAAGCGAPSDQGAQKGGAQDGRLAEKQMMVLRNRQSVVSHPLAPMAPQLDEPSGSTRHRSNHLFAIVTIKLAVASEIKGRVTGNAHDAILAEVQEQIEPLPSAPLTRSRILPKRRSGERDCRRRSYSFGASPEITTRHMDKQNEILMEAYRSMLHESQKLQV